MILGIDIGISGAIAVFEDTGEFVDVYDLPVMANGKKTAKVKLQVNGAALAIHLEQFMNFKRIAPKNVLVFVEAVSAMPKQGVASMFSLGHSFGTVTGVLAALKIPFLLVTPQEWKKAHGLLKADKSASRTMAQQRFPLADLARAKDHNRAEACLIGLYGVHRNQGWESA